MRSVILVFALVAAFASAAPAPSNGAGPGPGQRLAQINAQLEAVSGKINFPTEHRDKVASAIQKFHTDNQKAFSAQAKRGLDQDGWARVQTSIGKSGKKLKSELGKLVLDEQQEYVNELVDLMGQSFVLRSRIQLFQQRRQQNGNN